MNAIIDINLHNQVSIIIVSIIVMLLVNASLINLRNNINYYQ